MEQQVNKYYIKRKSIMSDKYIERERERKKKYYIDIIIQIGGRHAKSSQEVSPISRGSHDFTAKIRRWNAKTALSNVRSKGITFLVAKIRNI